MGELAANLRDIVAGLSQNPVPPPADENLQRAINALGAIANACRRRISIANLSKSPADLHEAQQHFCFVCLSRRSGPQGSTVKIVQAHEERSLINPHTDRIPDYRGDSIKFHAPWLAFRTREEDASEILHRSVQLEPASRIWTIDGGNDEWRRNNPHATSFYPPKILSLSTSLSLAPTLSRPRLRHLACLQLALTKRKKPSKPVEGIKISPPNCIPPLRYAHRIRRSSFHFI
jgi:hypothetical protein